VSPPEFCNRKWSETLRLFFRHGGYWLMRHSRPTACIPQLSFRLNFSWVTRFEHLSTNVPNSGCFIYVERLAGWTPVFGKDTELVSISGRSVCSGTIFQSGHTDSCTCLDSSCWRSLELHLLYSSGITPFSGYSCHFGVFRFYLRHAYKLAEAKYRIYSAFRV
jgi:hypothetical protein